MARMTPDDRAFASSQRAAPYAPPYPLRAGSPRAPPGGSPARPAAGPPMRETRAQPKPRDGGGRGEDPQTAGRFSPLPGGSRRAPPASPIGSETPVRPAFVRAPGGRTGARRGPARLTRTGAPEQSRAPGQERRGPRECPRGPLATRCSLPASYGPRKTVRAPRQSTGVPGNVGSGGRMLNSVVHVV